MIGNAKTPSSKRRSLNRLAVAESPSITGVIGVSLRPMSNPIETSRFLKYFVFAQSFLTWRGSVSRTSIAAVQAAATAPIADDAFPVRIVDVDHRAEFLADPSDVAHGCDVAVHREHAIRDDEDLLRPAIDLLESPLEVPDVAMSVDHPLGLRQADPVDDAPVVQLV